MDLMTDKDVFSLVNADARRLPVPDGSVHCVVTSPPYWGLRDYGHDGQIGLEATPEEYVAALIEVFRDVRRCLRDDGVLWLNLGDSYAMKPHNGMKPKDLVGIPWMVAFALRADGWYLRQDIIWAKPNPMPESVRDRCTKAHEYLFLLTKSPRYYFGADALKEPAIHAGRVVDYTGNQKNNLTDKDLQRTALKGRKIHVGDTRNRRSVWFVSTSQYRDAHFAVMPGEIATSCILAGTSTHGCCSSCGSQYASGSVASCECGAVAVPCTVLDPFCGSGTTVAMAVRHGRRGIGIDGNDGYLKLARDRVEVEVERRGVATPENVGAGRQLGLIVGA